MKKRPFGKTDLPKDEDSDEKPAKISRYEGTIELKFEEAKLLLSVTGNNHSNLVENFNKFKSFVKRKERSLLAYFQEYVYYTKSKTLSLSDIQKGKSLPLTYNFHEPEFVGSRGISPALHRNDKNYRQDTTSFVQLIDRDLAVKERNVSDLHNILVGLAGYVNYIDEYMSGVRFKLAKMNVISFEIMLQQMNHFFEIISQTNETITLLNNWIWEQFSKLETMLFYWKYKVSKIKELHKLDLGFDWQTEDANFNDVFTPAQNKVLEKVPSSIDGNRQLSFAFLKSNYAFGMDEYDMFLHTIPIETGNFRTFNESVLTKNGAFEVFNKITHPGQLFNIATIDSDDIPAFNWSVFAPENSYTIGIVSTDEKGAITKVHAYCVFYRQLVVSCLWLLDANTLSVSTKGTDYIAAIIEWVLKRQRQIQIEDRRKNFINCIRLALSTEFTTKRVTEEWEKRGFKIDIADFNNMTGQTENRVLWLMKNEEVTKMIKVLPPVVQ